METERLILRPLCESDTDAVFAMTSDETVARFMRFDTHTEREQARKLIEEYGAEGFAILDKQTGGMAGLFAMKPGGQEGWYGLSVLFLPQYWGRGYCREVLARMIRYASEDKQAVVLEAYVVSDNTASCRSLERNGFHLEETLYFDDLTSGLRIYRRHLREC